MLDNDPRYLRPESRLAMARRIQSLAMSPTRGSREKVTSRLHAPLRHGSREVGLMVWVLYAGPSLTVVDRDIAFFLSPKLTLRRPPRASGQRTSQPLTFLPFRNPST